MTILDKIIANKKKEIARAKKAVPLKALKSKLLKIRLPANSFKKTHRLQLIAEIKPKSPSAGVIRKKLDSENLAKEFTKKNVGAISVLTDKKYFGADLNIFFQVRGATKLPLLRKEFIIDSYQIYESKIYGANVVLLIACVLKKRMAYFVKLCLLLGLQPLIEIHNEQELKSVLKSIKPSPRIIIGVNNRDLKTLQIDLNASLNLVKLIPKKFIRISESGISKLNQLEKLSMAGFDAVLIGEGLLKNPKLFDYFL